MNSGPPINLAGLTHILKLILILLLTYETIVTGRKMTVVIYFLQLDPVHSETKSLLKYYKKIIMKVKLCRFPILNSENFSLKT